MKTRRGYQQGDVLIFNGEPLVEKWNLTKVQPKEGRYVLVLGEHTGNAHFLEETPIVQVFVTEDGRKFFQNTEPVLLKHGDREGKGGHKPQIIAPGWHEVGQVKEIDPFSEEISAVQD